MNTIQTEIKVRLKDRKYFENTAFKGMDLSFLKDYFNRPVTIKSIDPINKACQVEEIFGTRFYPEDFKI